MSYRDVHKRRNKVYTKGKRMKVGDRGMFYNGDWHDQGSCNLDHLPMITQCPTCNHEKHTEYLPMFAVTEEDKDSFILEHKEDKELRIKVKYWKDTKTIEFMDTNYENTRN